jgi:hypothetical protein
MSQQLELFARRGSGPARSGSGRPAQAPTKINARSPPEPFDFAAAIALDPRAVPRPDVPAPEWLRLPGVDDQT